MLLFSVLAAFAVAAPLVAAPAPGPEAIPIPADVKIPHPMPLAKESQVVGPWLRGASATRRVSKFLFPILLFDLLHSVQKAGLEYKEDEIKFEFKNELYVTFAMSEVIKERREMVVSGLNPETGNELIGVWLRLREVSGVSQFLKPTHVSHAADRTKRYLSKSHAWMGYCSYTALKMNKKFGRPPKSWGIGS